MDFSLEYTKEQEALAKEVRAWLDKNVPQDLVMPRDPLKSTYEQWQKRRELSRKLGEKGWLYPGYPREYGGGGLRGDYGFVIRHELAKRQLALPPFWGNSSLAAPAILACGTEEQKKRFLPPILKGEVQTWQLFTEPEAGTDEANQQTNALHHVREKDYFIINGQKIFVGGLYIEPEQEHLQCVLLTRSDLQAPRHENLAMFICPLNLPGITIQSLDLFMPGTFLQVCSETPNAPGVKHSVFFDNVRLHESYLIGGERDGWKVANAVLLVEHGDWGAESARGIPQNVVVEKLLAQCRDNPHIVKRLRENPQLLDCVANVYISAQIERLFAMRNAWLSSARKRQPGRGPQLGVYSKLFGARLTAELAKVLGPYALTDDAQWGLEDGMFELAERSGVCLAPGGTPEAQKIAMSRALGIGRA